MIRWTHLGFFKWHHADTKYMRANMQAIIKAMRYRFVMSDHAPVLNCKPKGHLGVRFVGNNQLAPYDLIQKSYILNDERFHEPLRSAIQAQIAKRGTPDSQLRSELNQAMTFENLSITKIQEVIVYIIQNTPGQWILAVLGFFYYTYDTFMNVTHDLPCYMSPQDKQNNKVSWVKIPFFKVPMGVFKILCIWCGLPLVDFPVKIGPFVDELHLLSYMDSAIQLCYVVSFMKHLK